MVRLIDANEIEWYDHFDSDGNKTKYKVAYSDEMPPTIDAEPQWIPCNERLPEALEEVLVTSKYGHVYTSRIVHGEFEYGGEIIAWMPLPEPYEVKE